MDSGFPPIDPGTVVGGTLRVVKLLGLGLYFLLTGDNPNKYDKKPQSDVVGSLSPRFAVGPGSAAFALSGAF
jgi:hypothetical protein